MLELLLVTGRSSSYAFLRPTTGKAVSLMRRTILLLAAIALALMVAGGVAWAADGIPPTVRGTVPSNGATDVALDAKIKVKFSEPMKDRTINPTNIYITVGEGTETRVVPATVDYVDEITPVRAVLKPTEPLLANTVYTVVVEGRGDGDMKAVKDASGTPLATDYTFSFTTAQDPVCIIICG
jgi:hypothetical protein